MSDIGQSLIPIHVGLEDLHFADALQVGGCRDGPDSAKNRAIRLEVVAGYAADSRSFTRNVRDG